MMKKKTTKQAMLLSVLSILLCVSMLVGSTFAWFTDSVTSGNNRIVSGNLDIELEYHNGTEWKTVNNATDLFTGNLWEPGHTEVVYLRLSNLGSLALKYQLAIKINSEVEGTNVAGNAFKLSDYISMGVEQDVAPGFYTDRADAVSDVTDDAGIIGAGYVKAGTMLAEDPAMEFALVVYMPETVGNEANYMTGTTPPSIDFGITLVATQMTAEADSFDNQYDADASYPGEANTATELITALKAGKNVKLGANIDLANVAWTPIASYSGIFDGAGYTISNLKGENGLFDQLSGATVKNLVLEGVDIDANSNHTGAVAGYIVKSPDKQTVIENVTVSGSVTGGDYYVGGLIGADSNYDTVIRDCTNNATVVAPGQQVGGIVGYATRGTVVENCVNNGSVTGGSFVGGIIGFAAGDDETDDMAKLSVVVKGSDNNGAVAETNTTVTWAGGVGGIIGNVGRAAGDSPKRMLTFYIADCTVLDGQAVYGQKHNVINGNEDLLTVYVGESIPSGDAAAILNAVKAIGVNESRAFFLTADQYDGDLAITRASLGNADRTGDLAFVALPGSNPVLTGKATLATRGAGIESGLNCNMIFDGITFEQANKAEVSIYLQDIKGLTMKNCTLVGNGEYVFDSKSGNATGPSRIENCTFLNGKMQVYGNFGSNLVVDGCTFINSAINVAAGSGAGTKILNSTFDYTLTEANVDDSFYLVRGSNNGNGIPVTVKNCDIKIDSALTEVAQNQEKWGVLWNRGTVTPWTIEGVDFILTDAAKEQTEIELFKTAGAPMNSTGITLDGTATAFSAQGLVDAFNNTENGEITLGGDIDLNDLFN